MDRVPPRRPNAILLMPDGSEDGAGSWRPGRITAWDANSQAFNGCPSGVDGKVIEEQAVKLPRLSVMHVHSGSSRGPPGRSPCSHREVLASIPTGSHREVLASIPTG